MSDTSAVLLTCFHCHRDIGAHSYSIVEGNNYHVECSPFSRVRTQAAEIAALKARVERLREALRLIGGGHFPPSHFVDMDIISPASFQSRSWVASQQIARAALAADLDPAAPKGRLQSSAVEQQ